MNQGFDILGRYKYPKLKLCKPDRSGQCYIAAFNELKIKLVFNNLSELSFEVPWLLDGKANPVYNRILGGKVLFADEFGYFIIQDVSISGDGIFEKKSITAISAEVELARNKLNRVEDTLRLYDPTNPSDASTVLGFFLQQNKRWSLGTVDSELWEKYRNFDIQTTDWYNFLIGEVEKKFMCIFQFDNVNRIMHCRTIENATKNTNIFASYDNLIDKIRIEEKYNETFTALNCYGADDLDIRGVNPIGGNIIYNYNYFKLTDWISQGLIDHINEWEAKIKQQQPAYKDLLTNLREKQASLTTKESDLVELNTKLKSTEQAMAIAMTGNNDSRYNELVKEKNKLQVQIADKESEIKSASSQVDLVLEQTTVINNTLSFESNFTEEEIHQLKDITIVDNYQNDGFKKTSIMTPAEIQDESQALYDYSIGILEKVSQPKYYFKSDMVNFVFLKEYEKFTRQADVGSIITVEIRKGWRTKVVILSIELDFDNPMSFSMEFSNRHRLDNGTFEFNDLYSDVSSGKSSYDWDKAIITDPVKSGMLQNVNNFINGNLEASKNSLESAKGIGVTMDGSGLHLRRQDDQGNLLPHEIWMTGDQIAFSGDNFNSLPKIAIGRFTLPNSSNEAFGINSEFLAGRLIVGNQFLMEAENGSFKFDGTGASLFNSTLEVIDKSSLRRILIDPNNGFKIQGRLNTSLPWEDRIGLSNDGNAYFNGKIEASSGTIAGIIIDKNQLRFVNGDYIRNDGYGKISLLTYTPNSATFNGDIFARNLRASHTDGWIGNKHIADNSISGMKLEASYRDSLAESLAKVEAKADKNSASIESLTTYTYNEFNKTSQSISSVTQTANANSANITSLTSYTQDQFGSVNSSITFIQQNVKENSSEISIVANQTSNNRESISSINVSVRDMKSEISLKADKVDIQGLVSFSDLRSAGATVINGSNITTGSISANRISGLSATIENIVTKTLSSELSQADYIYAKEIGAVALWVGGIAVRPSNYVSRSHKHTVKVSGKTYTTSTAS